MTKKLAGLFAAVALVGAGAALAQQPGQTEQEKLQQGQQQAQEKAGMPGMQMGQHELMGQVVKVEPRTLFIQQQPMGAVIPLRLQSDTQFENLNRRDLKEGFQVRASFDIRGTDNVATRVAKAQGAGMHEGQGGSGTDTGLPSKDEQPQTNP